MTCSITVPGVHSHYYNYHFNHPLTFKLRLHSLSSLKSKPKPSPLKPHSSLQLNHTNSPTTTSTRTTHSPDESSSSFFPNFFSPTSTSSSPPHSRDGDPELRGVLELATKSELFEIEKILFGASYFSPLLKSVTNKAPVDRFMIDEDDVDEREYFIQVLESRFLYLAADARSTLRGWRPTYRNILLDVRKELNIPCSKKLSTEDLEVEIFIYMIHECSRDWNTSAALKVGAAELGSLLLKGGQLISLLKISKLVTTRLPQKILLEAAKNKFEREVFKKGFVGATSRYLGFRSLATFFGPILWGTFLADTVIQMLGTDYIRILQAIYAFAQIRILRRHGLHLDELRTSF